MDYNLLLEVAVGLGYHLSMSGAETYRIEDSVSRVLHAYGLESEVFAVPNNLIVSIETPDGRPMTRMRRIGYHGNDLDAVEKFNTLSRWLCDRKPEPEKAMRWLRETREHIKGYPFSVTLFANFLGAFGFCFLFGGTLLDALGSGLCGLVVGIVNRIMDKLNTNQFVRTLTAAFFMAMTAYAMGAMDLIDNADATIIGSLMLLVPGLLFTNAMRDIMSGDSNSGINRIMQVLLIAVAICLGTAAAWNVLVPVLGEPTNAPLVINPFLVEAMGAFLSSLGFCLIFNIHGPGMFLCAAGAVLTWSMYCLCLHFGTGDIMAYFWATVIAAGYAEIMARIRKSPAIAYLVVSVFPLIPGAGVYYTMSHAIHGDMASFAEQGTNTIAIAAMMAVGMLLVSTAMYLWGIWQRKILK